MYKIGVIGAGNMGEAIIASSLKHFFVHVSEKDAKRREYLNLHYKLVPYDLARLVQISDIIILAVKPQDIDDVLKELSKLIKKETLVISIAAGITTGFIEGVLGKSARVVRTMPNMPALVNQGITAVCAGTNAKKEDIDLACKIFNNLGKTVVVKEESIDAITAVSGSGPAYVFLFMECMIEAAKALGLDEKLSAELVKQTFSGSVNLLLKQGAEPKDLRAKVTSKGGTTQAALDVFANKNIDEIITKALSAAQKRAKALARR